MSTHPLIHTLKNLRGNARGIVYTEALWGIPFNLYAPYVSIYMISLGLTDSQVGLITTISLVFQIFTAAMSGIITDRLGRKRTTLIFDLISWSVACLIWASAQNFAYFVLAAAVNSAWRIPSNSWLCLLVEDTDPNLLVDIYSWIYMAGMIAAFFAPLAGLLINTFSLVPTMRGLYLFAFVMMTSKFIATNIMVTETQRGQQRMEETKHQPITAMLAEYKHVFKLLFSSKATLYTIGIMLVLGISNMISSTFWAIIVTERLHVPAQDFSLYYVLRSIVMILFFFLVMPRIRRLKFERPMLIGLAGLVASQLILITIPAQSYLLLVLSTFMEACSLAAVNTLTDILVAVTVNEAERARIMAVIYVVIILLTSPFGWISGILSDANKTLPFVLRIALIAVGGLLVFLTSRLSNASPNGTLKPSVESEA